MSNIKCQMSIWLNFCRSVPPEFLQSFFLLHFNKLYNRAFFVTHCNGLHLTDDYTILLLHYTGPVYACLQGIALHSATNQRRTAMLQMLQIHCRASHCNILHFGNQHSLAELKKASHQNFCRSKCDIDRRKVYTAAHPTFQIANTVNFFDQVEVHE